MASFVVSAAFSASLKNFTMGDFHSPSFDLDVSEAFRAEALGVFGHRFDLALRRAGEAFGVERFHHAADWRWRR